MYSNLTQIYKVETDNQSYPAVTIYCSETDDTVVVESRLRDVKLRPYDFIIGRRERLGSLMIVFSSERWHNFTKRQITITPLSPACKVVDNRVYRLRDLKTPLEVVFKEYKEL